LIPRRLGIEVTKAEQASFAARIQRGAAQKEALTTKLGMLAERLRNTYITIKKRAHDDDRLYGAVSADEVIEALKEKDFSLTRKQIQFDRAIKTTGEHRFKVKLTSKLSPEVNIKVVGTSDS
jgi:large subunit ribosomal protein L9